MPMLKRGYGAVRNLRGKSGARFPPSTVLGVSRIVGALWQPLTLNPKRRAAC